MIEFAIRVKSYQTLHLFGGFIGAFAGQLKADENSLRLDSVPITLEKVKV